MFTITLTMEETNEMSQMLKREIRDLGTEIRRTDDHTYRESLSLRRRVLEDMLTRTEAAEVAGHQS